MRLLTLRSLAAAAVGLAASWAPPHSLAQQAVGPREELLIQTKGGEREFQVEIADDARETSIGLMFRREMAENEGMLFDFGSEAPRSFWMQNTYIPLDMIFIKADGTIISIAERTTPLSEKPVPSKGSARFVLEVNAGMSDSLGIEPGDKVGGPAIEARP
jgi:uncharacterized membrane protein (UPF0127 family)